MDNRTRRFIAGAICPACGNMDSLTVVLTEQGRLQECVDCNFSKQFEDDTSVKQPQVFFHTPAHES